MLDELCGKSTFVIVFSHLERMSLSVFEAVARKLSETFIDVERVDIIGVMPIIRAATYFNNFMFETLRRVRVDFVRTTTSLLLYDRVISGLLLGQVIQGYADGVDAPLGSGMEELLAACLGEGGLPVEVPGPVMQALHSSFAGVTLSVNGTIER